MSCFNLDVEDFYRFYKSSTTKLEVFERGTTNDMQIISQFAESILIFKKLDRMYFGLHKFKVKLFCHFTIIILQKLSVAYF